MLINEIFDSPYSLVTNTSMTNLITNSIREKDHGLSGLIVYEVSDDPSQFFILIMINGAWEVHHQKLYNGELVSGQYLNVNKGPNPRYMSTALELYRTRLDKGHKIRVVGTPQMWSTYQRSIERIVKNSDGTLITEPIDQGYVGFDGGKYISQEVKPRGKFREMFKDIKLPIK
jgi:hypothetical protein